CECDLWGRDRLAPEDAARGWPHLNRHAGAAVQDFGFVGYDALRRDSQRPGADVVLSGRNEERNPRSLCKIVHRLQHTQVVRDAVAHGAESAHVQHSPASVLQLARDIPGDRKTSVVGPLGITTGGAPTLDLVTLHQKVL